jgi:hypothetical protein
LALRKIQLERRTVLVDRMLDSARPLLL